MMRSLGQVPNILMDRPVTVQLRVHKERGMVCLHPVKAGARILTDAHIAHATVAFESVHVPCGNNQEIEAHPSALLPTLRCTVSRHGTAALNPCASTSRWCTSHVLQAPPPNQPQDKYCIAYHAFRTLHACLKQVALAHVSEALALHLRGTRQVSGPSGRSDSTASCASQGNLQHDGPKTLRVSLPCPHQLTSYLMFPTASQQPHCFPMSLNNFGAQWPSVTQVVSSITFLDRNTSRTCLVLIPGNFHFHVPNASDSG